MTKNDFLTLCLKYSILPEVALENELIVLALANNESSDIIEKLLLEEF